MENYLESVEFLQVSHIVSGSNYQEIFFKKPSHHKLQSIRLNHCSKDLSFLFPRGLFRRKAKIELHSFGPYPIKLCVKGQIIGILHEEDYSTELKELIRQHSEEKKSLFNFLEQYIRTYPCSHQQSIDNYDIKDIWLKTYLGTILWKYGQGSTAEQQKRLSLYADILCAVEKLRKVPLNTTAFVDIKTNQMLQRVLSKKILTQNKFQEKQGYNAIIQNYLCYLISALYQQHQKDLTLINNEIYSLSGIFSCLEVDYLYLMHKSQHLQLYKQEIFPNYIFEEAITSEDIKNYLQSQNKK